MKIKTIIILSMIMLTSVFFAGCIGDDEPDIEGFPLVINETPAEVIEETPVEEPEVETPVEEVPVVDPETYSIRMEHNMIQITSPFEINRGDTVVWVNNENILLTLISEDELLDDFRIVPGRRFDYTFNESGTYNFSIIGQPRMSVSIVVK